MATDWSMALEHVDALGAEILEGNDGMAAFFETEKILSHYQGRKAAVKFMVDAIKKKLDT